MNKKTGYFSVAAILAGIIAVSPDVANATDLLFYSSVPRNLTEPLVKAFESKNPDVSVTMFQSGTEALLEKVELEIRGRGKPTADVLWIQDLTSMQRYAETGLLDAYTPKDADKIPEAYRDKNGFFTGTFVSYIVLMYNSRKLTDGAIPKGWADLTDPRYEGQMTFADPSISGTGAVVASALVQNFGWEYWEKIGQHKPMVASGHPAMVSTIIAGERTLGPMQDFSAIAAQKQGQPIGIVFPKEGAIAVAAYAAVVHGTAVPEAAHRLVDFLASKEAAAILHDNNMYHTRVDAVAPEGWPAVSDIKLLPIDWAKHREEKDEIKDKFNTLMGQ